MSIEVTGPRAYDQQYRITVLATLQALTTSGPNRVLVEEQGGEDAVVEMESGGISSRLEIQVKTATGDFDLAAMAGVLAHFPPHLDEGCLLQRLVHDSNSQLLLVAAARMTDAARGFLSTARPIPKRHSQPPLTRAGVENLAAEFRRVYSASGTALEARRSAKCEQLAQQLLMDSNTADALMRAIVWEQVNDQHVRREISELLMLHPFRVPLATAGAAIAELTDAIRAARDSRGDALIAIREILRVRAAERLGRSAIYIARPEHSTLVGLLERTALLALTGHSKSGKTAFAREYLDELQGRGWRCEEFGDADTARRFLMGADVQNRACLVDDPFETANPEDLAHRVDRVRELTTFVGPARRAIVTSRWNTLRRIDSIAQPGQAGVAGLLWHDMTVRDLGFALRVWSAVADAASFDPGTKLHLDRSLSAMSPDDLLQPGQLAYLARRSPGEIAGRSEVQLVAIARYNAADIAGALNFRSRDEKFVIAALGLCAGRAGIRDQDLAYILSTATDRPGRFDESVRAPASDEDARFPKYVAVHALSSQHEALLSEMEDRGFLHFSGNLYRFAHPDYALAFWLVARQQSQGEIERLLDLGVSCLDPRVASAALEALCRAWDDTTGAHATTLRDRVVALFKQTIFPLVQEQALRLLLARIERFSADEFVTLMYHVALSRRIDPYLLWFEEVPWLDRDPNSGGFLRRARAHREATDDEIRIVCAELSDPSKASAVSPRRADAVNTYFLRRRDQAPDLPAISRISLFEFSFLRIDAAQLLFRGEVAVDPDAIRLLRDPDPRVAAASVQACLENWHKHVRRGQTAAIISPVREALSQVAVSVLVTTFLFDIGDHHSDYGHVWWSEFTEAEKNSLWDFWAECMSVVLPVLAPHALYFKDGDLWETLRVGSQRISRPKLCPLFEAWIDWIEIRGRVESLSDYSMGVADLIYASPSLNEGDREQLLRRCLNFTRSDPLFETLKSMVDRWPERPASERQLVVDLFNGARRDRHWLIAGLLVRDCPVELLHAFGIDQEFYRQPDLVSSLPLPIVRACMAILCRRSPGNTTMTTSENPQLWDRMWRTVLFDRDHPDHDRALYDLSFRIGIPLSSPPWLKSRSGYLRDFRRLCGKNGSAGRLRIFTAVLTMVVHSADAELSECWKLLFEAASDPSERRRYAKIMADHAEALDVKCRPLGRIGAAWAKLLELHLIPDALALNWAGESLKLDAQPSVGLAMLEALYRTNPPRLLLTHDRTLAALGRAGMQGSDFARAVEEARSLTFKKSSASYDILPEPERYATGWVY